MIQLEMKHEMREYDQQKKASHNLKIYVLVTCFAVIAVWVVC